MSDHLRVAGILRLLYSGVILVLSIAVLSLGAAFLQVGGAFGEVVGAILLGVMFFLSVVALPGLAVAYGLLLARPWVRALGIIVSALDLINFPVGTAIGGYTLWVLLHPETPLALGPPTRSQLSPQLPLSTPQLPSTQESQDLQPGAGARQPLTWD